MENQANNSFIFSISPTSFRYWYIHSKFTDQPPIYMFQVCYSSGIDHEESQFIWMNHSANVCVCGVRGSWCQCILETFPFHWRFAHHHSRTHHTSKMISSQDVHSSHYIPFISFALMKTQQKRKYALKCMNSSNTICSIQNKSFAFCFVRKIYQNFMTSFELKTISPAYPLPGSFSLCCQSVFGYCM